MFPRLINTLKNGISHGAMMISNQHNRQARIREAAVSTAHRIYAPHQEVTPIDIDPAPNADTVSAAAFEAVAKAIEPATPESLVEAVDKVNAERSDGDQQNPIVEALSMDVGHAVEWTSSNTTKCGTITHVLLPGQLPSDVGVKIKDATTPRDHFSYIVEAKVDSRKRQYWPRVSLLRSPF